MSNLRRTAIVLGLVLSLALSTLALAAAAAKGGKDAEEANPADYAIVTLGAKPLAAYDGSIPGLKATKPTPGHKLDLRSEPAAAYGRYIASQHENFRAWLRSNAPQVEVVKEYSVVLNGIAVRLHGISAERLRGSPDVADVVISWLYRPSMDVSVPLIHAPEVWATLGVDLSGETPDYGDLSKIKVGVVDTGIIPGHPFIDSCREANPVVHRGPYFSGIPFGTDIVFDHGTHVAGTIGGCKITGPIPVGDVTIALAPAQPGKTTGFLSGVAPGVTLFDYNVFPGMGVGYYILGGSAFSHDIIEAVEQAVIDGMDVINLSLGGGVQGPHDVLADALNAAVDAGVVAAVAAGNSGPGIMTVQSPGSAANVITAGASTNPHFLGIPVTLGTKTFGAALGQFNNFNESFKAGKPFVNATPARACSAIMNDVKGKIAVINRGDCTFTTKVRNAENAGAIGVLVVNNVAGDPIAMAQDGTTPVPKIPAAMVSMGDGAVIRAASPGTLSIDGSAISEFVSNNQDILAGFSSRGPTPYTFLIKPDITAPGVNVLSSVFEFTTSGGLAFKYAFFQGTSMATPHTAGAAALLLAAHPDWTPAQVKSALVNTADRPVGRSSDGKPDNNPNDRGGGRINVWAAANTPATLTPASVSFGVWTGGKPVTATMALAFRDETGKGLTCALSVTNVTPGSWVSVLPSTLTVPAHGTATATVALNGGRDIGSGFFYGDVVAICGDTTLRAPWFVGVQRGNGGLNGNMNGGTSDPEAIPAELLPALQGTAWTQ